MTSRTRIGMAMDNYLNAAIKDVITEFPEVGTILAKYEVGCVTCEVGTCLLKDVVGIHGLSPEAEQALMAQIARAVAPGAAIGTAAPEIKGAVAAEAALAGTGPAARTTLAAASPAAVDKKEFRYSPPLRQLVDEHVLIKKWVALIPRLVEVVDVDALEDRELLVEGVDFIRSYADKFHHAKEEDILFGYFDSSAEIILAMLSDHESARAHVRSLVEAVEARDGYTTADHLAAYSRLLSAHITKEDEILYPWMDRQLSTAQIGELFSRFAAVNEAAGAGFTDRYQALVARTESAVESRESREEHTDQEKVEATP